MVSVNYHGGDGAGEGRGRLTSEIPNLSWCFGWEEDGGVREQTWRRSGARGGRGSRGLGLACALCSAIRTPPRLHGALTQSPVPGHVLARRQLIGLSKKPTGWGAAILQREALGVQGHTLSRAQVASSWRLTLVCWPPPGFAPVCVALGCVWPGEALHTPPASRPDARPSPWAALEDCGVRGCGRARVRGPASPTPTAPSLGAWQAE